MAEHMLILDTQKYTKKFIFGLQLTAHMPMFGYMKNSLARRFLTPGKPIYDLIKSLLAEPIKGLQEMFNLSTTFPLDEEGIFSFARFPYHAETYCRQVLK